MKALQDEEGGDIPADVEGESYGNDSRETWGYRPKIRQSNVYKDQMTLTDYEQSHDITVDPLFKLSENMKDCADSAFSSQIERPNSNIDNPSVRTMPAKQDTNQDTATASHELGADVPKMPEPEQEPLVFTNSINRDAIANFLNRAALITYEI